MQNVKSTLAVIVLYKEYIENSIIYLSLINTLTTQELDDFELFIYDNSPHSNYDPLKVNIPNVYIHNPLNPGICQAYNEALDYAQKKNKKWLLLFDQDTTVNRDYLISSFNSAKTFDNNEDVVAIVPQICTFNKIIISPCKVNLFGRFIPISISYPKLLDGRVTALNSGTMLKIEFMTKIDGFAEKYTLDMLDHWLFAQVFKLNKKVYCHATSIEHNLTVYEDQYMDNYRYERFLVAEREYYLSEGIPTFLFYKLFLLLRIIRHLTKGHTSISKLTWHAFITKM